MSNQNDGGVKMPWLDMYTQLMILKNISKVGSPAEKEISEFGKRFGDSITDNTTWQNLSASTREVIENTLFDLFNKYCSFNTDPKIKKINDQIIACKRQINERPHV